MQDMSRLMPVFFFFPILQMPSSKDQRISIFLSKTPLVGFLLFIFLSEFLAFKLQPEQFITLYIAFQSFCSSKFKPFHIVTADEFQKPKKRVLGVITAMAPGLMQYHVHNIDTSHFTVKEIHVFCLDERERIGQTRICYI